MDVSMFLELHTTKWHIDYPLRNPVPPPTGAIAEFQLQQADKFPEGAMEILCQHIGETMLCAAAAWLCCLGTSLSAPPSPPPPFCFGLQLLRKSRGDARALP